MSISDSYDLYRKSNNKDALIAGLRRQNGDLYARALELYIQHKTEGCDFPVLSQQEARRNEGELIEDFRKNGIQRFGLYAYEGEEDAVKADMRERGYCLFGENKLVSLRGRLFMHTLVFDKIRTSN